MNGGSERERVLVMTKSVCVCAFVREGSRASKSKEQNMADGEKRTKDEIASRS